MITIIDYGAGNLRSVANAALSLGKKIKITSRPDALKEAKKIILPGVGHFAEAVKELKKRDLFDVLKQRIKEDVPFLGICVGMQLLLEESEEAANVKGLGIIKGKVKKFSKKGLIVPHMGWNQAEIKKGVGRGTWDEGRGRRKIGEGLFKGIENKSFFYFAHSYYCSLKEKKAVLSTTKYGVDFASSLRKDNIWGVQFHPEKSQKLGLKVFDNFLNI